MATFIKPTRVFSDELLQRYRQQGDPPADAVITAVVANGGPTALRTLMRWLADTQDFSTAEQHPAIQDFFRTYATLPAWADPLRMQRGMAFFQKHIRPISLILGLYSLPYSYLGAKGVQVLWLTERIRNDTARRLQETGEWIMAVNNPNEWQQPANALSTARKGATKAPVFTGTEPAVLRTLKIRLIHAGSRWFTQQTGRWQPNWDYPINQEDMAGTNLTFSYIVLLGLRKMGISTTDQEEEDYLHHINVVDYLNGVTEELLPKNLREAVLLGQAISRRQFAPSEAGAGLTHALINAIVSQISQAQTGRAQPGPDALRNLVAGEMRFYIGDRYADWLGIPRAPIEKRLAGILGRLLLFPNIPV